MRPPFTRAWASIDVRLAVAEALAAETDERRITGPGIRQAYGRHGTHEQAAEHHRLAACSQEEAQVVSKKTPRVIAQTGELMAACWRQIVEERA